MLASLISVSGAHGRKPQPRAVSNGCGSHLLCWQSRQTANGVGAIPLPRRLGDLAKEACLPAADLGEFHHRPRMGLRPQIYKAPPLAHRARLSDLVSERGEAFEVCVHRFCPVRDMLESFA